MVKFYIIAVFILVVLFVFVYTVNKESFVGTYNEYVSNLVADQVPFGRVFSRDSYNMLKVAEDPGRVFNTLSHLQ